MSWLARAIVRLFSWVAPSSSRARWREEWLGEIESQKAEGKRQKVVLAALGAPRDALATKQLHHQLRRRGAASGLSNDVRHAFRLIVRSPGHVAMVVTSLSIGLTATIVAIAVLGAIFRGEPPGVLDRQTLTRLEALFDAGGGLRAPRDEFSRQDLEVLQRSLPEPRAQVEAIAGSGALKVTIRVGDGVESVIGRFVSGNYFDVLGTRPALGRLLTALDDRLNADVAVITHDFWQKHFHGRSNAIGERFVAGNRVVQIVGVTPAGFNPYRIAPVVQRVDPQNSARIILPLSLVRDWPGAPAAGDPWLMLAARLKPGGSRYAGEAEIKPAARALEAAHPAIGRDLEIMLNDFVLGRWAGDPDEIASVMAVLLTGPLILLAIGCANVVNLRLARATRRTHELAVRLALGAGRARVIRLLLIEAGAIALVSLVGSWAAARAIVQYYGGTLLLVTVPFDDAVLASAIIVGAVVIVVSGLAPAWLVTRRATLHGLKQTAQAGGLAHSRLRATLVVVQVALSIVVLAIGSLFARSLHTVNKARADVIDQLLVARIDLASQGYDPPVAAEFARTLLGRLQNDLRLSAVGIGTGELFGAESVRIRPAGLADEIRRGIATSHVTPEWFHSMNLRPLSGRLFTSHDGRGVAIVNETTARLLAQNGSPVGMTISVQRFRRVAGALVTRDEIVPVSVDIIGVVPDSVRRPDRPLAPVPWMYLPLNALAEFPVVFTLFARTQSPDELAPDLSRLISDTDRRVPWTRVQTASELFATETSPARSLTAGVGSSGLVALVLAAAGLFAVLAYSVSLRSREIGIRMALGADPRRVTALVLRQAFHLTLTGIATGYALALPLAYTIRVVFLGVSPFDPIAMVPVALALVLTGCIAAVVPARRAASVDPVAVLRAE